MPRRVKSSLLIASTLACAGCLVTNELEFEANRNLPSVKPVSPRALSVVPETGSDECGFDKKELFFKAEYYDDDIDQPLFVVPKVNGIPLYSSARQIDPDPMGTARHLTPIICVPTASLGKDCNLVQLFVSDQANLLSVPDIDPLKDDPRVEYVEWWLIRSGVDTPGAPGKPYIGVSACAPDNGDI